MSKYKVGDKIVFTVIGTTETGYFPRYVLNDNFNLWKKSIDELAEPLSTYTEPLEAKIRRQAAEITRLLAENKELKEDLEKAKIVNLNVGRLVGKKEAWSLCNEICKRRKVNEIQDMFNHLGINEFCQLFDRPYSEIAEKFAQWEKAREEIKVGDVFQDDDGNNAIVTSIKGNTIYYMWDDGDTRSGFAEDVKNHFTKTGRHIDVDSFLKQIGEE